MGHQEGDKVWMATTFVEFDGRTKAHVVAATVAGVLCGDVVVRQPSGTMTVIRAGVDTLHDSETEAWAAVAQELSAARDRVQAAIDNATAKAAGSRVGEAVPA